MKILTKEEFIERMIRDSRERKKKSKVEIDSFKADAIAKWHRRVGKNQYYSHKRSR